MDYGDDSEMSCPLCLEDMDSTDRKFQPCHCGYQICLWCWHHIMEMAKKDSLEGRCPACRTPYDKEKIASANANERDEFPESGADKKQKLGKGRTRAAGGKEGSGPAGGPGQDARKHLSNVRVIQRNLVYVVGMPYSLADEETLERKEYFGQYGKVLKIAVSRTSSGVGSTSTSLHGPTANVYVTYVREEDAVRCIQAVDGCMFEGRILRACFGTTKYCNAWLKNLVCPNPDCLYLHEVGTQEDSYTKEEMLHRYNVAGLQPSSGGFAAGIAAGKHHAQYESAPQINRKAVNGLPPPLDGQGVGDKHSLATYMAGTATSAAPPGAPHRVGSGSNLLVAAYTKAGAPGPVGSSAAAGASSGGILPPAASWGAKGVSGKVVLTAPKPFAAAATGGSPAPPGPVGVPLAPLPVGTANNHNAWPAPQQAASQYSLSTSGSAAPGANRPTSAQIQAQQFKPSAAVLSGRVIQASAHSPPVFGTGAAAMSSNSTTQHAVASGRGAGKSPNKDQQAHGESMQHRKSPPSPLQSPPPPIPYDSGAQLSAAGPWQGAGTGRQGDSDTQASTSSFAAAVAGLSTGAPHAWSVSSAGSTGSGAGINSTKADSETSTASGPGFSAISSSIAAPPGFASGLHGAVSSASGTGEEKGRSRLVVLGTTTPAVSFSSSKGSSLAASAAGPDASSSDRNVPEQPAQTPDTVAQGVAQRVSPAAPSNLGGATALARPPGLAVPPGFGPPKTTTAEPSGVANAQSAGAAVAPAGEVYGEVSLKAWGVAAADILQEDGVGAPQADSVREQQQRQSQALATLERLQLLVQSKEEEVKLIEEILEMPLGSARGSRNGMGQGNGTNGSMWDVVLDEDEDDLAIDPSWIAAAAFSSSLKNSSASFAAGRDQAAATAAAAALASKDPLASLLLHSLSSAPPADSNSAKVRFTMGRATSVSAYAGPGSGPKQSRFSFARTTGKSSATGSGSSSSTGVPLNGTSTGEAGTALGAGPVPEKSRSVNGLAVPQAPPGFGPRKSPPMQAGAPGRASPAPGATMAPPPGFKAPLRPPGIADPSAGPVSKDSALGSSASGTSGGGGSFSFQDVAGVGPALSLGAPAPGLSFGQTGFRASGASGGGMASSQTGWGFSESTLGGDTPWGAAVASGSSAAPSSNGTSALLGGAPLGPSLSFSVADGISAAGQNSSGAVDGLSLGAMQASSASAGGLSPWGMGDSGFAGFSTKPVGQINSAGADQVEQQRTNGHPSNSRKTQELEPWQLLPDDGGAPGADAAAGPAFSGLGGLVGSMLPGMRLGRTPSSSAAPAPAAAVPDAANLLLKATSRRKAGGRYGFGLEPEERQA